VRKTPKSLIFINKLESSYQVSFLEFFAATIRNKNTRAAYVQAAAQFFRWCEQYDKRLATIRPPQSPPKSNQSR